MAVKNTEGKIKIEGISINLGAIKNQKPKVLKADLAEAYFSSIPESKRQEAADALWAAITGKEVPESAVTLDVGNL